MFSKYIGLLHKKHCARVLENRTIVVTFVWINHIRFARNYCEYNKLIHYHVYHYHVHDVFLWESLNSKNTPIIVYLMGYISYIERKPKLLHIYCAEVEVLCILHEYRKNRQGYKKISSYFSFV